MTPEQILSLPNPNEGDSSYTFERGLRDGYKQALEDVAELLRKEGAEDSLPVTEEWLRSVGFTDDRVGCPTLGALHIQPRAFQRPGRNDEYSPYACIRSLPIPNPKTRGDVRRLCAALGVKLEWERT